MRSVLLKSAQQGRTAYQVQDNIMQPISRPPPCWCARWVPLFQICLLQEMMLFLQKPPTQAWDEKEIELILSQAYMWTASFGEAQSHLQSS